jgi:DNA-binding PadR family transcriptional regulator
MVILGFLRRGSLHGYELKRIIERDMGDWAGIAFGSIYFALSKLAEEGSVTAKEEEGEGKPSRIVYTITKKGREEFRVLLRECWSGFERHTDPLDLGIAFMDDLDSGEARSFLEKRAEKCERALAYLESHEKEELSDPNVPNQARFIFSHARSRMKAELAWTKSILREIDS